MTITQARPSSNLSRWNRRLLQAVDNKLYSISTRRQRAPMLYLAEARFFAWLCGQPWAQRRYWPGKVETIQRFLRETNLPLSNSTHPTSQVMQQALFCDSFFQHWRWRLRTWQSHQLAQVVTVQGWEQWLATYQQGKGVILLPYHTLAARLFLPWLTHAGIEHLLRIGTARQAAEAADLPNSPFFHARQLHAAQGCLAIGGVVQILPDGFQGSGGILLPLYQRTRLFRTAFAELALLTGAAVTPASAILNLDGKIEITFHPPLHIDEQDRPRNEQIAVLVQQYVAFLHTAWATAPGNISVTHMARFLQQSTPSIAEGTNHGIH